MTPPTAWASIDDCGEFPCTAPLNFALSITGSTWTNSVDSVGDVTVDVSNEGGYIVSNNSQLTPFIYPNGSCKKVDSWNGYWCAANEQMGCFDILLFENDEGKESSYHRSI